MRPAATFLALLLALQVAAACSSSVPEVERREIKPWLVCGDCTNGELDRVVAMGETAERYLRAAISDGPTRADDSVMTRQSVEGVARANRYRNDRQIPGPVSPVDSSEVITRQLDDFRLRYRLRAAEALRRIDPRADSIAVRSLCSNPPPELVRMPEYRPRFATYGICP